jgi:glucose-6-phosphate isomerase
VDFLGFVQSQHDLLMDQEQISSHDELMSNFFAQPDALANGKTADEVRAEGCPEELVMHKVFDGNRPSSSLLFPQLSAYVTGQILSLYEHRTAVQGFIWDLNSFDQWGVELGKKLAVDVKGHLLKARYDPQRRPVDTGSPATSRILNYYLQHGRDPDGSHSNGIKTLTSVTRLTHREHFPPTIHDLGGNVGKLS